MPRQLCAEGCARVQAAAVDAAVATCCNLWGESAARCSRCSVALKQPSEEKLVPR